MQDANFNIEPKPVETIPVSTLMEEAKKTLDKLSDVEVEKYRIEAAKIKTKFNASDWLNVIKGLAQQKGLQALGLEPNTNFSFKTFALVAIVITIIIIIFSIMG